jgi:hypothetical protein
MSSASDQYVHHGALLPFPNIFFFSTTYLPNSHSLYHSKASTLPLSPSPNEPFSSLINNNL